MGSLHKKSQLMLVFLKTILGPTLFLLYINDLLDIICNIAIYADDTTLYTLQCDQASHLWQQLELASELEFDLEDTEYWDRKCLVILNVAKAHLVSLDLSNNTSVIDVKIRWVCSQVKII